jgi:hypothetical protein
MPATTPNLGIPYPLDADAQSAFPALAKTAAERLDSLVKYGSASVTIAANQTNSTHVTFPAAFDDVPYVFLLPETSNPSPLSLGVVNRAKTGFDIRGFASSAQTFLCLWVAIL